MTDTTTEISRAKLAHPDLNYSGGEDLHEKVATIYTTLGDWLNSRFFSKDDLANEASQDFEHNFKTVFSDLYTVLYLRNSETGALTRLSEETTPKRSAFLIAAKSGSETTHITVTNNTGEIQDIALAVSQGRSQKTGIGLLWHGPAGHAPLIVEENSQEIWFFEKDKSQKAICWLKIPKSYIIGTQIKMLIVQYSPSSSGTQLLEAVTYLIRKNTDAITENTNYIASGNSALSNSIANQYREAELILSDASGKINSIVIKPGDLLRLELIRGTDTDAADIRFVPQSTEIYFS